ncbi:hypothetical protein CRG98_032838 [Punica granatum]|uniref:ABC-2 type transporter transmembrane domain-containing protein n=1 Tax=Punica granatum TaxID=22663 RepID=A0A2I0ITM1_PUNGR|nr:hypothetical protein CRG98_032838 [Punica granatum]
MLVGPAKALFMDEISTGLDSSTTYQIINSLKHMVHILNRTAVISLLQPAPETYDLFDDIILLSDDRIVKLRDELSVPYDRSKNHHAALATRRYGVGKKELLKANISREYLLMKRNSFVYIFNLIQLAIMAFIGMTVFLKTNMHRNTILDGGVYTGALFLSVTVIMFNGMSELSMTLAKLHVFYKQRDLLFFPAWSYALPTWILKIPIAFMEVSVWVFITYYVIGFDPDVGR